MADLVITFSKSIPPGGGGRMLPIADGDKARTESIALDSTAGGGVGALTAANGEDIVDLSAQAACWVEIGTGATAGDQADCWYMAAGDRMQFWVDTGENVAAGAA